MRKLLLLTIAAIVLAGAPVCAWAQNNAIHQTHRKYKAKKYKWKRGKKIKIHKRRARRSARVVTR
jgi:hypothetical protein